MNRFQVTGRVISGSDAPVSNAQIRLISDLATLGASRDAVIAARTAVVWTRLLTGFAGHRWSAYISFVRDQVAGISFADFKAAVVAHNPTLQEDGYLFRAERSYVLPENDPAALAITWDRTLTGFAGNRWQCWSQLVAGKVIGLSWAQFKAQVVEQNPSLAETGYRFLADQQYALPQNPHLHEYELVTTTSASGRYRFDEVPTGTYRLEIRVDGQLRRELVLTVTADRHDELSLLTPTLLMQTSPEFVQRVQGEFRVNGQPFGRFVGVNLPHLLHYGDTNILPHAQEGHQREMLKRVQEVKGRVVRVFLPHHRCSNERIIERLQRVLGLMEEFRLYLLPAFIDLYSNAGAYPQTADLAVDYCDFQDGSGHRVRLSDAFFRERYKGFYWEFVQAVVTRFAGHPRILAWEIGNEMKHEVFLGPGARRGDPDQFVAFNLDVARKIKQWDGGRHMVTTGMLCTRHAYLEDRPDLVRKLYGEQESPIDFITVHAYENGADVDATLAFQLQRPVLVEEAGIPKQLDNFQGRLRADLRRWFEEHEYRHNGGDPRPRQRAAGYMLWRFDPLRIGEGSGEFHDDFNIIRQGFQEFV
jgi:hypothetical protein